MRPGAVPFPYPTIPVRTGELAWALADVDGPSDWPARLHRHLDRLCADLNDHRRLTEGERGSYAEVVNAAPRLAHGIHRLIRDHEHLAEALGALRVHLDAGAPITDLRRCAADLLALFESHRQRGISLLYEAYATDIGGET